MDRNHTRFFRARNPDGSFRSICTMCYLSAAHRAPETELDEAEREHVCYRSLRDRQTLTARFEPYAVNPSHPADSLGTTPQLKSQT